MEQGGPDSQAEPQSPSLSSPSEANIEVSFMSPTFLIYRLCLLLNQTEMLIVPPLLCLCSLPELAFLWSAIVPGSGLKSRCRLQTSHPSSSSHWVLHAA